MPAKSNYLITSCKFILDSGNFYVQLLQLTCGSISINFEYMSLILNLRKNYILF